VRQASGQGEQVIAPRKAKRNPNPDQSNPDQIATIGTSGPLIQN
jgi:hypothetical protein